jgi:hypothetical protein
MKHPQLDVAFQHLDQRVAVGRVLLGGIDAHGMIKEGIGQFLDRREFDVVCFVGHCLILLCLHGNGWIAGILWRGSPAGNKRQT